MPHESGSSNSLSYQDIQYCSRYTGFGGTIEGAFYAGFGLGLGDGPSKITCCDSGASAFTFIFSSYVCWIWLFLASMANCCCDKLSKGKCLQGRRLFSELSGWVTSISISLHIYEAIYCGAISGYAPVAVNVSILNIVILTVLMLIFSWRARTRKFIKGAKGDSQEGQKLIYEYIKNIPTVSISIQCYHYKRVTTGSGKNKKTRRKKVTTYTGSESVPYSGWWADGDLSSSETFIETQPGKYTFISMHYDIKYADEHTSREVTAAKSDAYRRHQHRDQHCDTTIHMAVDHGPIKFSLCPEGMSRPLISRGWFYYLTSILPVPFFNGMVTRRIINMFYSCEVHRNIDRFIEIKPLMPRFVRPPSNPAKGFQGYIEGDGVATGFPVVAGTPANAQAIDVANNAVPTMDTQNKIDTTTTNISMPTYMPTAPPPDVPPPMYTDGKV